MCNLLLSVLFVVTLPPVWKALYKSITAVFKGIGEIARWVKTTTDSVANDAVMELIGENRLSPANAKPVYWVVRSISFLVMLYAIITALSILSVLGGM